jgi:hypothetical protein
MDFEDYTGTEMVQAEAELFEGREIIQSFLSAYGFEFHESSCLYRGRKPLPGIDGFEAEIEIDENGRATGHVFDTSFGHDDEYLLLRVMSSQGEFATEVRDAYVQVLKTIREKCSLEPGIIISPVKDAKRYKDESECAKISSRQKPKTKRPRNEVDAVNGTWLMFSKSSSSVAFETGYVSVPTPAGVPCRKGDSVYVYIGAPVNAIMFKCNVTEVAKASMFLSVEETYTSRQFPKTALSRFGTKSIRGIMPMPRLLFHNLLQT